MDEKVVVFDIETVGVNFDKDLDEQQKEYLLKYAKSETDAEEIKKTLSLHAVTAQIVTIAFYNPYTRKGGVYFQTGNDEKVDIEKDGIVYRSGTEAEIIKEFWNRIMQYNAYITFNGRGFDVPFVRLRSAILGVKCPKEIMTNKWRPWPHIDLLEELTFQGATRKFNLDMYCKAFGIKSPKETMHGSEVGEYFARGEGLKVAEYCMGDVVATGDLYLKLKENFFVGG